MDKASVYGTGDCRFESYQDHFYFWEMICAFRCLMKKLQGGFEPPSLDSKSRVLTVTPLELLSFSEKKKKDKRRLFFCGGKCKFWSELRR